MFRRQKTVYRLPTVLIFFSPNNFATIRAYGGVLSHKAAREKILQAFLIEEQKIVMKVLNAQGQKLEAGKTDYQGSYFVLILVSIVSNVSGAFDAFH